MFVSIFSFIQLVDYIVLHLLHVMSSNSLGHLVFALKQHFYFIPTDDKLQSLEIDIKLEDVRPPDAPQVREIRKYIYL